MSTHPNASVSAATTGLAALVLYVLHRFGYGGGVTNQDALLAAGFIITAVLFVGRRGLKATLQSIWRGSQKPAPEPAPPLPPAPVVPPPA